MQELAFREANETRTTQSIAEFVQLKDREKEARLEVQHLEEQLRKEKEKGRTMGEQVSYNNNSGNHSVKIKLLENLLS